MFIQVAPCPLHIDTTAIEASRHLALRIFKDEHNITRMRSIYYDYNYSTNSNVIGKWLQQAVQ